MTAVAHPSTPPHRRRTVSRSRAPAFVRGGVASPLSMVLYPGCATEALERSQLNEAA